MRLQSLSIIFIIILLPIVLVLTAYTQTQIDTISLQTQYSTKLKDSTYDAISAFQINTVHNTYSTVSDSMRRDIEAAVQTFMKSMASNLGISGATEETIKPYIPAIVFTLYDGYYIYSPSYSYDVNTSTKNVTGDYNLTGKTTSKYDEKSGKYVVVSDKTTEVSTDDVIKIKRESEKTGNQSTTEIYDHLLKPYIYYTVRYAPEGTNTDIVVNYSLDNYVVIYGYVNGEYITKSGYLVKGRADIDEKEKLYRRLPITTITFTDNPLNKSLINDQATIDVRVMNIEVTNEALKDELIDENGVVHKNDRLYNDTDFIYDNPDFNAKLRSMIQKGEGDTRDIIHISRLSEQLDENNIPINKGYSIDDNPGLNKAYYSVNKYVNGQMYPFYYAEKDYNLGWYIDHKSENYYIDAESAKKYYDGDGESEGALAFTNWVKENLKGICASDARTLDGKKYTDEYGNNIFGKEKIFDIGELDSSGTINDPESDDSIFSEHKRTVIKMSIEDNLSQAMASYNKHAEQIGTIAMPVLTDKEWDQVLKNVCMITFMQGIQVGTKIYNDYSIVTSTKNKEYVTEDTIYFINENGGDGKYHKIGCTHLDSNSKIVGYKNSDYDRQVYDYDVFDNPAKDDQGHSRFTTSDEYYYMHGYKDSNGVDHLYDACYYCVINSTPEGYDENWRNNPEKLKAYNTSLAREKYNFYKTNAYFSNPEKRTISTNGANNGKVN